MRLLQRLGHHIARRHGKTLPLEASVRFHHHHLGRFPHRFFPHEVLLVGIDAESLELAAAAGRAGAPFDASVADQVQRGKALGNTRRMIEAARHEHDSVAQPDPLGALAAGRQEDFRRRRMGVLLQEMVLHLPGVFDAQAVRQLDLLQRLLEQPVLALLDPWPRQLMFVENAELHETLSLCRYGPNSRQTGIGAHTISP